MTQTNEQVWRKKWEGRHEPVNACAKALVRRLGAGKGRRLLDVGCGNGADSLYFASQGFDVVATDFSESGIAALKRGTGQRDFSVQAMLHDTSKKFPFADGSFDVIYAHLSLHYFDDKTTRTVFAEMRRLLRKGGLFFVQCKSVDDDYYGEGEKIGPDTFRHGHLRHFFTKEYMAAMLENFTVLSLRRSTAAFHGKRSAFIQAVAKR